MLLTMRRRSRPRTPARPARPVAINVREAGSGAGEKDNVAVFNVNVPQSALSGPRPSATLIERLLVGANDDDTTPPALEAFSEPLAPRVYVRQDTAPED